MDECKNCANADNEYCFACENGNQFKPITNADRIRSMSDEKLARWIALHPCLPSCPAQTEECFKTSKFESCTERWLDWLREEISE